MTAPNREDTRQILTDIAADLDLEGGNAPTLTRVFCPAQAALRTRPAAQAPVSAPRPPVPIIGASLREKGSATVADCPGPDAHLFRDRLLHPRPRCRHPPRDSWTTATPHEKQPARARPRATRWVYRGETYFKSNRHCLHVVPALKSQRGRRLAPPTPRCRGGRPG